MIKIDCIIKMKRMHLSNELTLLFKDVLKYIPSETLVNICYKNGRKIGDAQLQQLSDIFEEDFKYKIKTGTHEVNYNKLIDILKKIFKSNYYSSNNHWIPDILGNFDKVLKTFPNMLETYLMGWSFNELVDHFGGRRVYFETECEFKYKLKQIYHDEEFRNMLDELTEKSMSRKNILKILSTNFKENIVIYDGSYTCQMYHNNEYRPIPLYKHNNGLYSAFIPDYCDDYKKYIAKHNTLLTKKYKIQQLLELHYLLHYFYPNDTKYIEIINVITDLVYDQELEWFDYAICEAIFHRFTPIYKIYIKC